MRRPLRIIDEKDKAAKTAVKKEQKAWGTDYPHPNVKEMPNDGEQVDLFAQTITDEATRRRILVDNPTKLYWPENA